MQAITQLLDALQLYADKLQAIATDDTSKQLDQNSTNLANALNSFDQNALSKIGAAPPSQQSISLAVTALRTVADLILEKQRYDDVRQAVDAMNKQGAISHVADLLKECNNSYSLLLGRTQDNISQALLLTLRTNKPDLAIYKEIRADYRQVASVQAGVSSLNAALDGLANANAAIASASQGGVLAAIQNFAAEAEAAYQFYKNISSTTGGATA
jgi:hypothetical protein